MPRRKIDLDVKVAALRASLRLVNLDEVVSEYHVSQPALYNWYHEVLDALPEILVNEKPGRKPKPKAESVPPF